MRYCSKTRLVFILLFIIFCTSCCLSLFTGSSRLSLTELFHQISNGLTDSPEYRIFIHVRLPRTIAAIAAGAALAVSGSLIQSVLNNALASPNIIGVNSGAGFFSLLAASLLPAAPFVIPFAAFSGALCTSMLIYTAAVRTRASRITIVLAGVAISSILSAGIDTLTILFPDDVIGATGFMIGSFSGVTLKSIYPAAILIAAGILISCIFSYDLNVLSLGEDIASGLGMNVPLKRLLFIVTASLLAGSAVSFAGLLGFIGLIVPHICRRFTGSDNRVLIPCAALAGSSLALICDSVGKMAFAPFEIPVGIILSFLGGPFFLFLLLKKRRGRIYD